MKSGFWFGVCLVITFCCLNNIFLEYAIVEDRGAGPLLTLLQFLLIAGEGMYIHWSPRGFGLIARKAPLWWYLILTCIFWTLSVINNKAYDYEISQPLHMVFRSSSLTASLLLGFIFFSKRYSLAKIMGVLVVTFGVISTTLADSVGSSSGCSDSLFLCVRNFSFLSSEGPFMSAIKLQGVTMLTVALLLSGALGHLQRLGFSTWGEAPRENMFYQHLLSLFLFVGILPDLWSHTVLWNSIGARMWFYVIGNVLTQYVCLRGVYMVMAASDPLTMTLVLTCRKFVSIFVSVQWFGNVWSGLHWTGTFLVFGGVLIYSEAWKELGRNRRVKNKAD